MVVSRWGNKCCICLRKTKKDELIKNKGVCEYCAYIKEKYVECTDYLFANQNNIDEILEDKRKERFR